MTDVPPAEPAEPFEPADGAAAPSSGKGLAVVAIALGVCAVTPGLGLLAGLGGVLLGVISLRTGRPGRRLAIAGIVLSVAFGLVGTLIGVGIAASMLSQSRATAPRRACEANLNAIGEASHTYTAENGRRPPSMRALMNAALIEPKAFKCPAADRPGRNDYFVHWAISPDASDLALFACDLKGNHTDGRNVLWFNGTATFVPERAFQAALTSPENAAFAKALRQLEGP